MKYVIDWLNLEIKIKRSILKDKDWASDNNLYHKQCRKDMRRELKECVLARKILNEATVKRSELIDFKRWVDEFKYKYDIEDYTNEEMIDMYLKSINAAKCN